MTPGAPKVTLDTCKLNATQLSCVSPDVAIVAAHLPHQGLATYTSEWGWACCTHSMGHRSSAKLSSLHAWALRDWGPVCVTQLSDHLMPLTPTSSQAERPACIASTTDLGTQMSPYALHSVACCWGQQEVAHTLNYSHRLLRVSSQMWNSSLKPRYQRL